MITSRILLASLALLAGLLLHPSVTHAAESYDNCTGFIDSVPMTVSTQGVWCLHHNVATAITNGNAITVAGNNITIDCNDFKIGGLAAGNSSLVYGIHADNRQNVTVRNCNIRGFDTGIKIDDGAGHLIENNLLDNSLVFGIHMLGTDNSLVRRNRVFDTGGSTWTMGYAFGIRVEADVLDNTVDGVVALVTPTYPSSRPIGISVVGIGKQVRGNQVRGLVLDGSNGAAFGIGTSDPGSNIADNVVVAAATTAGTGIEGDPLTTCRNNTVVNFTTSYVDCTYSSGNSSLP